MFPNGQSALITCTLTFQILPAARARRGLAEQKSENIIGCGSQHEEIDKLFPFHSLLSNFLLTAWDKSRSEHFPENKDSFQIWWNVGSLSMLMVVSYFQDLLLISPRGFTFDCQLANNKLRLADIHHPILNMSRSNFATIESHSTNWKLQYFHQKCQLLVFWEVNFVVADGIPFPEAQKLF